MAERHDVLTITLTKYEEPAGRLWLWYGKGRRCLSLTPKWALILEWWGFR